MAKDASKGKKEAKAAAPAVAEATEPVTGKEAIYVRIGDMVKEMTQKRIGKTGGRKIFDKVVEEIFVEATKSGMFRFNAGFGSMHVKTYQAGSRRLPSGQNTTFGERQKLRYEEGVVVAGLVESKGDLSKVQAARAAAEDEGATPTTATAPATTPAKAEGDVEIA